ncbi:hypothetical protein TOPH_07250 [Tolypocladium ophioglossoides CBS 100239]|uniref:Uncharacterized protein n=1 Tax=Tolypocladium ophioglossoides (strain CBS 100239) TaxID=1163406 RepID=A0A0L0N206_TOLOC|nr:hypothetical protein TOPH_07250 [Tolypocladium ophioglossoides CBS 100239]
MTDDSRLRGISVSLTELGNWLLDVKEEQWIAYRDSPCISQCSHPERNEKIANLLRWGIIDHKGKFGVLLRCRGPCSERVYAMTQQACPGELIMLLENGSARAIFDGENIEPGESRSYSDPPLLEVAAETIIFLLAVFRKG